jgi:hypothetical protein
MAATNLNTIELNMGDNKLIGRCDRIRTYDPFTPSEVRYQAALHTDRSWAVYVIYFCLQR